MIRGMRIRFTFVPLPVEIVDESLDLSLNEYRLLIYLSRHQLKLGKPALKITQDELLRGRKRGSGERYDSGCLIKNSRDLIKAREDLLARGWIKYWEENGSWSYEVTIFDAESEQEQNVPYREQNVPENRTNCSRNQVQNDPAIIRNIDPLKDPSQEVPPTVENPVLIFDVSAQDAGRALADMLVLSGYTRQAAKEACETLKRRKPEMRFSDIPKFIADLWKEYDSQPTRVKVSIKTFLGELGRYVDSDTWRTKKTAFIPIVDWQGGHIGEDGVYVNKHGKRVPGFICPPKPKEMAGD